MAILPGRRLGPYEILSAIGAGGMGEVYRARDTRLNRDVALKVIPDAFAADSERMARFEREAKLLASLNHPHIASIYGLEESSSTNALVMELVEGPTLADRIDTGPIPPDEALPIAKQIAEALEYAHDHSVIHRDLKPMNIKVKPDGTVKVLDFGLAKALLDEPTAMDMSNSPTLSMAATMAGTILGTAAYMSPEQAKGKQVDRRADIWAFGVVLFEMLTGKQLYSGENAAETLAFVMTKEPAFDALPAKTPRAIQNLLRRCLEKNVKRRLQHIGEARIAIEDVLSGAAVAEPVAPAPAARRHPPTAWIVLAAVLLLALAAVSFVHFREAPAVVPEMRTEIVTPSTTDPVSFSLSPDGRQIVFVASGDGPARLWLRRLDAASAQPLAGAEGASFPFWSPDSRSVGFFADGNLNRLDLGGGSPQKLAYAGLSGGGTWSSEGAILFTPLSFSPIFRIPASGGQQVAVTKLDKQTGHHFPQFLPGGRHFLFYVTGVPETSGIYLGSLDSSETKRLTAADAAGAYLPNGWLLFIRAGALLAQRLELGRGVLTGEPVTVADQVAFDASRFAGAFSVSAAGLVAYRPGGAGQHQLVWFDRSGETHGTLGAPDANGLLAPSLSPDGRRAATFRTVQGNTDIWLVDETRTTRFTFDPSLDRFPVWSPDGSRIVFDSNRKGLRDLYMKPSNGAGSEVLLLESPQTKTPEDWSRDGRFLLYSSVDPQTARDIWVLPMDGDQKPFIFLKTNFDERRGQFSPDVRWVAYMSNESGRFEVYVRPFDGNIPKASTSGQWQISTSGGISPKWREDGKELYYIAPDGKLMGVPITAKAAMIEPGTPVALFQTRIVGGGTDTNLGYEYAVSGDGRFLINTVLQEATSPITLLQNWTAGWKK
jgi:eukaryotic-like serine/threonine-protein kinase